VTDEQVDRILASSHFQHLPAQHIETFRVEGKTLREALAEKYRAVRHSGGRVGANTLRSLQLKFGGTSYSLANVKPKNPDVEVGLPKVVLWPACQERLSQRGALAQEIPTPKRDGPEGPCRH
jgi:hypothetical protein